MKLVIDASMSLAWLFLRAKADEADCTDRLLLAVAEAEVFVPSLWHLEIVNAMLVAERRKIITEAQRIDFLSRLSALPIMTDDAPLESRRDLIASLAYEHALTAYDATYLELTLRHDAVLATFDTQLVKAMSYVGGKVFT